MQASGRTRGGQHWPVVCVWEFTVQLRRFILHSQPNGGYHRNRHTESNPANVTNAPRAISQQRRHWPWQIRHGCCHWSQAADPDQCPLPLWCCPHGSQLQQYHATVNVFGRRKLSLMRVHELFLTQDVLPPMFSTCKCQKRTGCTRICSPQKRMRGDSRDPR